VSRRTWLAVAVASVSLLRAAPAGAQDRKPVNIVIGAGVTVPQAEVRERFGNGYNLTAGIVFNIKPYLGLRVDYLYNGFPRQQVILPGETPTPVDLKHNMQAGLFDVVVRVMPRRSLLGVYVLGGPGVYSRRVSLSTPGTGTLPGFCDPYSFVCYPPIEVPVEDVKGANRTTDIGFNVGGGLAIRPGGGIVVLVEARYHYMSGPAFTLPDGTTQQAKGHYVPITVGLRF